VLRRRIIDLIAGAEAAHDRLKRRYKERFDRFEPAQAQPYRSYGREDLLVVRGRVLEEATLDFHAQPSVWTNIRHTIRRFRTDEIPGALVRACFEGSEEIATADDEGFFEFRLSPARPLEPGWHSVALDIAESPAGRSAGMTTGQVLVPPADADYIVVSDLDDTVLHSAATSKLMMISVVLLNDARSRAPFEGVGDLYRAFQGGPERTSRNPIIYLSRSPVNLYDMIIEFMEHHQVPVGPLVLMDYGLRSMLERAERDFKRGVLDELFAFYPDKRFVLIGDSGQQDPEIYSRLALELPDRVATIIIRDVVSPGRDREVHRMADEVTRTGVPMALVRHSRDAAAHAVSLGLLPADSPGTIHAASDEDEPLWRRALTD
jgi:phosphatidate phosphatase APP1